MKKILSTALILTMLLASVTSCADTDRDYNSNAGGSDTEATVTESETDAVTEADTAEETQEETEEETAEETEAESAGHVIVPGDNTSTISQADFEEILDYSNFVTGYNDITFNINYSYYSTEGDITLTTVNNNGDVCASYIMNTTGTVAYATEYSDENGKFAYSCQESDDYSYSSVMLSLGSEPAASQFAFTYAYYIYAGGQTIVAGTEEDGIATIKTEISVGDGPYYADTYTIDVETRQLLSSNRQYIDADGNVAMEMSSSGYAYNTGAKIDTTAMDKLTTGDNLCKLTYIINPGAMGSKTYTTNVVKGTYTGYSTDSGFDVKFYSDESLTTEVDVSTDADEVIYYVTNIPSATDAE